MVTKEDLQSFIDRLQGGGVESQEIKPALWLVRTPEGAEIVISYSPPVAILRVRVMEPPSSDDKRSDLYRQLLEFNARDLVHGSYGLEGEHVVLTDTLELENLDFSEFEASFESLTLALASHVTALAPYREKVDAMGIFERFSTMFRSNINDLISRAENPEKMLNQLILDMKTQLAKAKQEAAAAIADEKKLQVDAETMKKQAEDWERRAMLAVQEGRDDLAKQALARYNESLQGAQQLHETWVKSKADTENLKMSLRQLNDKIEEAKRKKNILVARAKRAEAQQRIQETMSGLSDKSAFESFDRMAEKIEGMERKAIAAAELQQEFSGDDLVSQFKQLEYKGSSDQQLIDLKAKMGMLGAGSKQGAKQLGQGSGGDTVHEAELVDDDEKAS